eukprot:573872-Pyramimonas_sp.AAC.1
MGSPQSGAQKTRLEHGRLRIRRTSERQLDCPPLLVLSKRPAPRAPPLSAYANVTLCLLHRLPCLLYTSDAADDTPC